MLCFRGGVGHRYNPDLDTWTSITTTNAPTVTGGVSTIWTGSEMIVWGGSVWAAGQAFYFDTGAKYHLASDTWYPITTTNAPTGRSSHGAVWTDNKMIIWGGRAESGITNTGSLYDPINDSWSPITTTNAPTRSSPHLIWTGSQVIVWGGADSTWLPLNDGALYDPSTESWTAMNTQGAPTQQQTLSLWTGTELAVFTQAYVHPTHFIHFYNPVTNTWHTVYRRLIGASMNLGNDWGVIADELLVTRDGVYDLAQDKWLALSNEEVGIRHVLWTGGHNFFGFHQGFMLRHSLDIIYPYIKD